MKTYKVIWTIPDEVGVYGEEVISADNHHQAYQYGVNQVVALAAIDVTPFNDEAKVDSGIKFMGESISEVCRLIASKRGIHGVSKFSQDFHDWLTAYTIEEN